MARVALIAAGLAAGIGLAWAAQSPPSRFPSAAEAAPAKTDWLTLVRLCHGQLKIVDLAWPLNRRSAYWPGEKYKPFELQTIATIEKDGVLSKMFSSPEHLGTHMDAPNHFERKGMSVDQIPPERFFSPGVLIDASAAVAKNPNYRLSRADVDAWERTHGRIEPGALVLLHTGWGRHWNDPLRYQNMDRMGRLHFPGFSAEAVAFLLDQRQARGVGLDTLSVDYGLSRDFAVHHLLGKAGCYGLENLAQLERLPPRGFFLLVAPIKIETGTGGPTRVFAVLPD